MDNNMKKTIWGLFRSADFCNPLIAWWSEFPQLGHIEKVTKRLNKDQRIELLDNHEVSDENQNQWTLEELEEGEV